MNKKVTGRSVSMSLGILVGTLVSLVITIVASMVIASLILRGKVGSGTVGATAMAILSSSTMIGTLVAGVMIKRRRLLVSIGVAISYFVMLLGGAAILFGGVSSEGVLTGAVIIMLSATLVGYILLKWSEGNKRVTKKRRYR